MALAAAHPLLVFVELLAASVWVGGFVAIAVVTRVARRQLDHPQQVAFFRALGRSYGVVGGVALVIALAGGAALLSERDWDGAALPAVMLAAALLIATLAGVVQARGMTRLRQRSVCDPADAALAARVRRGAVRALALRAAIGALTLALLALVAVLLTERRPGAFP
ncbi:MAG: hypothetical protein GEU88_05265 [Solirubrobacterales bacterium]|nr:hypothetical protein [Solirubrobacterales bacterium]